MAVDPKNPEKYNILQQSTMDNKCKICRRLRTKLFLKGEKCFSPKCPMVKKPYPPGQRGKRRPQSLSEYGIELREKIKLRKFYNISDRQLKNYVKLALAKGGKAKNPALFLIRDLEMRLDNVIFRLGLASSHAQARQLVSHGHFLVNGRPVNAPSYTLKQGDKVNIRETSLKKSIFQNLSKSLKKHTLPPWIKLDVDKLEGEIKSLPSIEDVELPIDILKVFEFYSR